MASMASRRVIVPSKSRKTAGVGTDDGWKTVLTAAR
jgi:hypothetical protein